MKKQHAAGAPIYSDRPAGDGEEPGHRKRITRLPNASRSSDLGRDGHQNSRASDRRRRSRGPPASRPASKVAVTRPERGMPRRATSSPRRESGTGKLYCGVKKSSPHLPSDALPTVVTVYNIAHSIRVWPSRRQHQLACFSRDHCLAASSCETRLRLPRAVAPLS